MGRTVKGLILRRLLGIALTLASLLVALALMIDEAIRGDDWPGWDEGWVLVVFPLGLPAPVAAGLRLAPSRMGDSTWGRITLVTGAIWLWGAALFLVWLTDG
jgi:hypothetical protein